MGISLQKSAFLFTGTKPLPEQPVQQFTPSRMLQSASTAQKVKSALRTSISVHWFWLQIGLKYFRVASYSVALGHGAHAAPPGQLESCWFATYFALMAMSC